MLTLDTTLQDVIKELKRYALDQYEVGGHWVYETWYDDDYIEAYLDAGGTHAAKEYIKQWWERVNEQQAETRWE